MSLTEDLLSTGFMNLSLKYFSAANQVKKAKRRKYKVISTMFPLLNEIIFSTKAIPMFLPRMPLKGEDYSDVSKLLSGTKLAEDFLGKNLLSKGLGIASKVVSFDSIVISQLDRVYANYKRYVEICEYSQNYYIPCFGTKLFYGAVIEHKQDTIDANLSFGTRCCSLNKSYELISQIVPQDIYIDLPNYDEINDHGLNYVYEQIKDFVSILEKMAGPIDDEKVIQYTEIVNNIKNLYIEFYHLFKNSEYLPMPPKSFQHVFSLINLSYVDLIAAPKYYHKNLKLLIQELKDRIKQGKGHSRSDSIVLILLPSFGGYDGELCNFAAEKNAYIFYSDWWFWGMLEPIDIQGDWMKNQAKFCLNVEKSWAYTRTLVDQWIKMIKDMKIDGVIFNDITGCNSISAAEIYLKEELNKINIPMVGTNFSNIGENLEQLRTRIHALIETVKNR